MNPRPLLTRFSPIFTKGAQSAVLAASLSLLFIAPANAADFSGNLKGVTITDAASSNKPPVAAFTYTVNGNTVNLDASSSNDPDGAISEYKWDFGDGSLGSGPTIQHTYSTTNNMSVTITAIDNNNGVSLYRNIINFKNCSSTPTYSQTSVAYDTTYWSAYGFIGAKYTGSKTYNICSFKYYVSAIAGNLSDETLYAQVYSLSGTSLGTLLGQKKLVPTTITTGWNTISFDSPIDTGSSGFALVISKGSEKNYIKYGYSGNSTPEWNTGNWDPDKTIRRDLAEDLSIEIFE